MAFAGATFIFWWKNRKIESRHFYALSILALAQLPLLTYNFLTLQRDPVWSQFILQNQTLSPTPNFYLWGFAPFWVFALYGIILTLRERNPGMGAMVAWVISGFTLAYLPVLIQRRFILGISIPLGILAAYGLSHILKRISVKSPNILKHEGQIHFAYTLLASISSIYLSLGLSLYMQPRPSDRFYPRDLESALIWLDKNAAPNDFVLANITTSQLVAQRTNLRVYAGHEMETLNFDTKQSSMKAFYEGKLPENWLVQMGLQWVIYGPYEKEISSFTPDAKLEIVYKNESVVIYKVK